MGRVVKILLAIGFLLGSTGILMAATGSKTFAVSATVPAPASVAVTAKAIAMVGTPLITSLSGTSLNFGSLSFDAINHIFTPSQYFVVAAGPASGVGSTSVTLAYTEGSNPNNVAGGSTHGLGYKTTATFMKVVGTTETALTAHGGASAKKLLKNVTSESIAASELGTGYFKVYLGIQTNPAAAGEPTGSEVFSAADKVGSYTGSLVVSATVV